MRYECLDNISRIALIRTEGSKEIGMGHLHRTWLLSNMFKSRFDLQVKLVMKSDLAAERFLVNRGIETILMHETISANEEIETLGRLIETEKPRIIVIDVSAQEIELSYIKNIKKFGYPIVAIVDDSCHRKIDADIIIKGNPSQIGQDYSKEPGHYLLGPMYFLMDPAYGHIEVKEPDGRIKKILLTFGGSDHNDLLFRVLDALEIVSHSFSILIVTSQASCYLERLQRRLATSFIPHELVVDTMSLAPLWNRCSLAITAGGNTLFERIATRLPGCTICQLDRQMEIANNFESLGVNFNLGFGPELSNDMLIHKITTFLGDARLHHIQYQRAPKIIDGRGLSRLGDEIEILLEGGCQ